MFAILYRLKPGTRYYYIFGDDDFGWSEEFSFMSAPVPGPGVTTRVLAFGGKCYKLMQSCWQFTVAYIIMHISDMGHGEFDDTRQVLKLEQPSLNTTKNLIKEMDSHDLIIDVGDISYADGYEPIVSYILFTQIHEHVCGMWLGTSNFTVTLFIVCCLQWDEYFDQVKTLHVGLPCMVNPGNHESDSPNSE